MSGLYQRRRRRPEMNLLPLIDVLVMLIFFAFVTMQFRSASTLNITLPKVETAGKNEFKGTVTIGVDNEGVMSFNGQVVTEDQIEELLQQVKEVNRDIPVLIAADEATPLKTVAFLMDACRKTGLNKFSLQSR
ncbi:MAG: ExbD/TolR family protein [Verrucomicrobiia bacterium]|tara:strand:- start:9246 stop:9644 length:399 start_codon:yes stop_codon:yes gene_type:complete